MQVSNVSYHNISRNLRSKDLSANFSTSNLSTKGKRSFTKLENILSFSLLSMIFLRTIAKFLPSSSNSAFPVREVTFLGNLGSKSYIEISLKFFRLVKSMKFEGEGVGIVVFL